MKSHLTKDDPQETLLQPDDSLNTAEKENKPYISKYLNSRKLSWSLCIATCIIKYCPYIEDIFALQNFHQTFLQQLVTLFNSGLATEIYKEPLMLK